MFVSRYYERNYILQATIHASGVPDYLLNYMALWVGRLRKVGINLQFCHIGLHQVTWLQRPFMQRNPPFGQSYSCRNKRYFKGTR